MNLIKFFSPGIWFMRQLRFATKMTLMAFALLVPLLLVLSQLISVQTQDLSVTRDA